MRKSRVALAIPAAAASGFVIMSGISAPAPVTNELGAAADAAPPAAAAPLASATGKRPATKGDAQTKQISRLRDQLLRELSVTKGQMRTAPRELQRAKALFAQHKTLLQAAYDALRSDTNALTPRVQAATTLTQLTGLRTTLQSYNAQARTVADVVRAADRADGALAAGSTAKSALDQALIDAEAAGKDTAAAREEAQTLTSSYDAAASDLVRSTDALVASARQATPATVRSTNAATTLVKDLTAQLAALSQRAMDLPEPTVSEPAQSTDPSESPDPAQSTEPSPSTESEPAPAG